MGLVFGTDFVSGKRHHPRAETRGSGRAGHPAGESELGRLPVHRHVARTS